MIVNIPLIHRFLHKGAGQNGTGDHAVRADIGTIGYINAHVADNFKIRSAVFHRVGEAFQLRSQIYIVDGEEQAEMI